MTSKKSEKAEIKNKDFRESENRVSEKAKIYIIRMIKEIRRQDINKSVKNKFFIRKTKTVNKKKLIISLENTSFLFIFFFSELRNLKRVKKITII